VASWSGNPSPDPAAQTSSRPRMVVNSNCARAVAVVVAAAVVAAVVVAAVEDIRSKGVVDTLPTVVDTGEGHDRMHGTSAEVH
jgi:hypothetical protein